MSLLLMAELFINISLVVEFQRWWDLKSKLFAQESTCSKEILIPTTLASGIDVGPTFFNFLIFSRPYGLIREYIKVI